MKPNFSAAIEKASAYIPGNTPFAWERNIEVAAGIYRCVVSLPRGYNANLTNDEIAATITNKFNRSIQYLANSISKTEVAGVYTLFARGVTPIIVPETASAKALVEVASNVFKDPEDHIWELSNGYFVRSDLDDFSAILGAARDARIMTAAGDIALFEDYKAGNPVYFYNPETASYRFGIAASDREVFDIASDSIMAVSPKLVVAASSQTAVPFNAGKRTLLDYLRILYGNNTEFFNGFKSLIEKHLKV